MTEAKRLLSQRDGSGGERRLGEINAQLDSTETTFKLQTSTSTRLCG
jgi:hypothetical protein